MHRLAQARVNISLPRTSTGERAFRVSYLASITTYSVRAGDAVSVAVFSVPVSPSRFAFCDVFILVLTGNTSKGIVSPGSQWGAGSD